MLLFAFTCSTSAGFVTVRIVKPLTEPDVASIVVVPAPVAVTKPCEPEALLIVATPVDDEVHVTVLVRFTVLPFP